VAVAAAALAAVWFMLPARPNAQVSKEVPSFASRLDDATDALRRGLFHTASEQGAAIWNSLQHDSDSAPAEQRLAALQLYREADLLAHLTPHSLDELVAEAADGNALDAAEWRQVFHRRHRGRAVLFDTTIRRDSTHRYLLDFVVMRNGQTVDLHLNNQDSLDRLSLQHPRRLLFGLRVDDIRVGPGGQWTIDFAPDSAVLLTNVSAAAIATMQPADDLRELVERQAALIR
jgi:hypothetical protein